MKKFILTFAVIVAACLVGAQQTQQTTVSTHLYPALDTNNTFTGPDQFLLGVGVGPVKFASLGSPINGHIVYCQDCAQVTPCAGSGNGAVAEAINGVWACASGIGQGTITGIITNSGSGLQGGGTSGSPALSLLTSCAAGQSLQWNGTGWACSSFGIGTITGITTATGSGLQGGGASGPLNMALATCPAGQTQINTGSGWACGTPGTLTGITTAGGSGLQGGASTGSPNLSLQTSCANNQYLSWNTVAWVCTNPSSTSITNVRGQSIFGNGTGSLVADNTITDAAVPALLGGTDPFFSDTVLASGGTALTEIWNSGFSAAYPTGVIPETTPLEINNTLEPVTLHLGGFDYQLGQGVSILIQNAPGTIIDCDGGLLDWSQSAPNPGTISVTNGQSFGTISGGSLGTYGYAGLRVVVAGVVVGTISSYTTGTFTFQSSYTGTTITNQPYNIIGATTQDHIIITQSPGTVIRNCTIKGDVIIAGGNNTGHNCANVTASDETILENVDLAQCGAQGITITNSSNTETRNVIITQASGSGYALNASIPPVTSTTVQQTGTAAVISFGSTVSGIIYPGMKINVAGYSAGGGHSSLNCAGCLVTAVGTSSVSYTATSSATFGSTADTSGTVTVLPFVNNVINGLWAYDNNLSPGNKTGNYAINIISSGYFGALKGVTMSNWHVDNNIACTVNGTTCTGDGITHNCNSLPPDNQPLGNSSTGSCSTGGLQITNNVVDYDVGAGSCRNTVAECTSFGGQRGKGHDFECFRGHVDQFGTPTNNGSGCTTEFASTPGVVGPIDIHDIHSASNGYVFTLQLGQNSPDDVIVNDVKVHDMVAFADTTPNTLSYNGAINNASSTLSTGTDCNFPNGIVGTTVTVAGAGVAGGLLTAVVTAHGTACVGLPSTNSITLSVPASTTVTGAQVIRINNPNLDGIRITNNSPVPCAGGFEGTVTSVGNAVTGVGTTFNAATDLNVDLKIGAVDFGNITAVNSQTSVTTTNSPSNISSPSSYTLNRQCKWTINNNSYTNNDLAANSTTPWTSSAMTVLSQPADIHISGPSGWMGTPAMSPSVTALRGFQSFGGFDSYSGPMVKETVPNQSGTGTTLWSLAKYVAAGAEVLSTSDTTGAVGICVGGCGTTGTPQIAYNGETQCNFDGATTTGDVVVASTTAGGNCHDSGSATASTSVQCVGKVLSTNAGSGLYQLTVDVNACGPTGTNASFSNIPAHNFIGNGTAGSAQPTAVKIGASDTGPNFQGTDSGSGSAYVVALAGPAATANTNGLQVSFTPANLNSTTTPTLAVSGLTAQTIVKCSGSALALGDLNPGLIATVRYDSGNKWELQNPAAVPCGPNKFVQLTGQVANISTTSLCGGGASVCGIAGQYRITAYLYSTVSCVTPNTAAISTPIITYTDNAGSKSIPIPMVVNGSATLATTVPLGNVSATGTAFGTMNLWSTGSANISYSTTGYTNCGTGTATYELDLSIDRVQ